MSSKRGSENLIYLIIWLIVLSLPIFYIRGENNFNWTRVSMELFYILPFLLIFIINNSLLVPKLLFRGKNLQYLLYVVLVILLLAYLFDFARYIFDLFSINPHPKIGGPPPFDHRPPPNQRPNFLLGERMFDKVIISFLVVGFNNAIKLLLQRHKEEKEREVQKKIYLQTELSFLKNQIGPHFFMNTLNNIHALVDISSDEAKQAIIKLSHMMGYMLYESQTEKIPLQKEMDFVKSYIELMRIRLTEDVDIELSIPELLPVVMIPPLLTISFIENAFKHGISYEEPSFVHIAFRFTDDKMFFEIENTIHTKKDQRENSGIGIQNARNRLALIYSDKYELTMNRLPDKVFSVKLNIPI